LDHLKVSFPGHLFDEPDEFLLRSKTKPVGGQPVRLLGEVL